MRTVGFVSMVLCVALVGVFLGPVRDAYALATGQVNVTGRQSLGEVTLQLTDDKGQVVKEDDDSDRAAGYWWWRNKRAGTYKLQVLRNGVPVGEPQTVEFADGKTSGFRVNAQSGEVTTVSSARAPAQMPRYSVGFLGGRKWTPFSGNISSTAGNFEDEGDIDESLNAFGIEGRLHLSPTQQRMQALGAGLFITGTYLHYASGGLDRFLGDQHPTAGKDVGVGMDEKWSFMLGFGKQFNLWQRAGISLMIGAHMTRASVSALFDESGGGGSNQKITESKTLFGPFIGAELYYTIGTLASFPIQFMLQTRAMHMPSTRVSASSNDTNWDYRATTGSGIQYKVLGGLRFAF